MFTDDGVGDKDSVKLTAWTRRVTLLDGIVVI